MKKIELKNIDPLDIEDLLPKIERSFGIEFFEKELEHIVTFGEFCEYVENKIELKATNDCTSQQAFYKLRDALSEVLKKDKKEIYPSLLIEKIIPKNNRKKIIKQLEGKIDFELNLLVVPEWLLTFLFLILFSSIITLFFFFKFGVFGIIFTFLCYWISAKFVLIYEFKTLGQIAEKMTRENYLKSRKNPKTFNRNEIRKVLTDIFSKELFIEKSELGNEAMF